MIDSVFGVGTIPETDSDSCVFVSDRKTWEENNHCCDYYKDDTMDVLGKLGFGELQDGCFEAPGIKREEIISLLSDHGFVYDSSFEQFMESVWQE